MRGRVVTFMHILFCTFLKHTVNLAQTGIRALKKKKNCPRCTESGKTRRSQRLILAVHPQINSVSYHATCDSKLK